MRYGFPLNVFTRHKCQRMQTNLTQFYTLTEDTLFDYSNFATIEILRGGGEMVITFQDVSKTKLITSAIKQNKNKEQNDSTDCNDIFTNIFLRWSSCGQQIRI